MGATVRRTARVLALVWSALTAAAVTATYTGRLHTFHPDQEHNAFAYASATVFVVTGLLIVWRVVSRRLPLVAAVLGAILLFLAVDEGATVHERLAEATDVNWTVLYVPLLALGAVVGFVTVRRMWPSRTASLFVAAGLCWALALTMEALVRTRLHTLVTGTHGWMMVLEETVGELGGASLLCLAAVAADPARRIAHEALGLAAVGEA